MIHSSSNTPEDILAFNNCNVLYKYFTKYDWIELSLGFTTRYINVNMMVCIEVDIEHKNMTIGNTSNWKQEFVCDINKKAISEEYISMAIKKYIRRCKLKKLKFEEDVE